jgi:hypothetical protein
VHKPQEDVPSTILFDPAKGNDFQVTIAVMRGKTGPGLQQPGEGTDLRRKRWPETSIEYGRRENRIAGDKGRQPQRLLLFRDG